MNADTAHYIEATVRYLTTEEGGRRAPVASGYRGQFHYNDDSEVAHDGFQFFPDVPEGEFVPLGTAVRTLITFPQDRWDNYHCHRVRIGTRFQIQEGRKIVGRGEVTNVDVEPRVAGSSPNALVLPPRFTPDSIAMSQAAARLKWRVERLPSWRVPEELCGTGVAIYGEPLFVTIVAGPLGTDVLEPSENWLPEVPGEYLRRSVRLSTLGEARHVSSPTFIKPVADKCFEAKVYASGAELPPTSTLDDSEHVLMSEPVVWEIEFRAFVMDRQIVALSPYLRHGELVEEPDGSWAAEPDEVAAAEAFCKAVLADSHLSAPPAFVLDVGIIADRGWAIIEANAAWGSGLYGCDPKQVLRAVRRACIPMGKAQTADLRWLRKPDVLDTD